MDVELVKRIGAATSLEVRATGIRYPFTPCIVVCRDPRWGRCYESYNEDPMVVQQMTNIIYGLQGENPNESEKATPYVACAKHFAGYDGINENNTVIDWNGLHDIHISLLRFHNQRCRDGHGFILRNGEKMHANRYLITGFLKGTICFLKTKSVFIHNLTSVSITGFIIFDWEDIDRITSSPHANYTYSVLAGVQARIDMVGCHVLGQFTIPLKLNEFISDLKYLVKNNFISIASIVDVVQRILLVFIYIREMMSCIMCLTFLIELDRLED
ncbi:hypothetical protein V2J09_013247 [Rumex salicifolius]